MRETSNPVFRSLPKQGGYAQFGTGFGAATDQQQMQQQMLAQQQAMMQPMATNANGIPDITQSGYVSPETMPAYQEGGGSYGMSGM